ncbi:MAG: tripartite tricarboxylate transporter permease [Gammaproteobacteria bacterium]|nr:tripartite tricarboxylate transporter permease [Gammaproteobacteria bacterium]CAJ2377202.1 MAG: Tricarboxylate transport membrane protein TctA [Arenicellales bacterium IbO2]MDA7962222.1 tripartite tricarboxylate transporter permease [Gammaproteobacteria bacterium]MDA7970575.1 tripartite tricarboxylate transporter permease [Gammaproteobacteria bacterium]MDA7972407.1 tripartite tricarboxylate transporter permease [Gammaproteobacteria bacterium]
MEFFANFAGGTAALFGDPVGVLVFAGGVLGGMLFGAIPGVSMLTLAAILLPFTAHLSPAHGIMLFSVIYCTGVYGGAITAILFNIPGAPENAPTAFDGYAMTRNGQAGKAVGAAVMCSALGGVVSALVMMAATAPIAAWAISAFGPPEIFALVFFGLTVAASIGADNIWKGWLSILAGLAIATAGLDPVGGIARYDFGMPYLLAGIHFIPVILGFFAVSEIFIQAEKKSRGAYRAPELSVNFPTLAELLAHKIAVARSVIIGFFCGILPGIGATLAAFMGYNEAVRWSKRREEFGRGKLEGVIASETANNAATGAAMIPLLALGLPGGALTAMMVGVFQMHNMEPGPLVFINSADLVWVVFAAMFFANLSILFIGYLETKTIINLLRIPFQFLAPVILLLATVGAYAVRGLTLDVIAMFAAGVAGFFLRRSGYSVAGIVLGLILGKIGEQVFAQSMQMLHFEWSGFLGRPIALALIIAAFLTLITSVYRGLGKWRESARHV